MDINMDVLFDKFKSLLTSDGRNRVFNNGNKLDGNHMKEKSDPEALTREFIIDPIFQQLDLEFLPEKHFRGSAGELRKVDYHLKNKKNDLLLVEAKPLNANLFEKGTGAVYQIQSLFKLAEIYKNYTFGVATDGNKWIFIDKNAKIVYELNITELADQKIILQILQGKQKVSFEGMEEEITKKFYDWYKALLQGGKYKNHENKTRTISREDCLVESVIIPSIEAKEAVAQIIMDRLIFIKFLQSREIVDFDLLKYLAELDEDLLNERLEQLFFLVFNTEKGSNERKAVDPKFRSIPYLNGSLFVRTKVEKEFPDYRIRSSILKEIISFLDSFKFIHKEDLISKRVLDPEILGYIFERAMTEADRKGTGAYYTPKVITKYIAESTIFPVIVRKTNLLLKSKGFKDFELVTSISDIYENLRGPTLRLIYNNIIETLAICDNACGSGAFLLAAAEVLLDIYKNVNTFLNLKTSEVGMRRLIVQNNLFGVDINPNAVEIAKLRLWLWIVSAYSTKDVKPLPNIEYNIRIGNSLLGYIDLKEFKDKKITLDDWFTAEKPVKILLDERSKLIKQYKQSDGKEARELKIEIEKTSQKVINHLNIDMYQKYSRIINVSREEFEDFTPFHWGIEFSNIFETDNGGFDVIIGNPPYIRIQLLKEEVPKQLELFKNIYKTAQKGNYDIYVLFDERTLDLLSNQGMMGYIQPHKFFQANYGENLREMISKNSLLAQIVNFKDQQIFVGASTYTCLLFLSKLKLEQFKYVEVLDKINLEDKLNQASKVEQLENIDLGVQNFECDILTSSPWNLGFGKTYQVMKKLEKNPTKLSDISSRIFQGLVTGADKVFILEEREKSEDNNYITLFSRSLNLNVKLEKEIVKPLLKGQEIRRYSKPVWKYWILYPYEIKENKATLMQERELKENYPNAWDYLKKNKTILLQRDRGKLKVEWYAFGRTQNIEQFYEPKIMTQVLANKSSFTLDDQGIYYFVGGGNAGGYGIKLKDINIDMRYILALLNSKLLDFYLKRISTSFRGGFFSYAKRFIENLPIVLPDRENSEQVAIYKKLIKLCEEALKGDEKAEDKIDELVFRIYNINDEEKNIIS